MRLTFIAVILFFILCELDNIGNTLERAFPKVEGPLPATPEVTP